MTLSQEQNLQANLQQKDLLRRIINRICRSLELQEILTTTVAEVRSFLGTDRVMIYKFHDDDSGQVIAESINDNKLPSLLGLNFPADDIPPHARELFTISRVRSVVNLDNQQIGQSIVRDLETGEIVSEDIRYRPVDPCHVEYLKAMGVKSTIVVPIIHQDKLWGLLVSHHSLSRSVSEYEIEVVQMVVEHLSVAIAHSDLLTQARAQSERGTIVNCIATLLHSLPAIALQPALETAVAAFDGSGGRLCVRDDPSNFHNSNTRGLTECLIPGNDCVKLYTYGQQPAIPEQTVYPLLEQYSVWQEYYKSGEYDVWAISDIYETPGLRTLQPAFAATKIRSILMIPLQYRQQLLGYLSIFRDEIDTEKLWAGQFDPDSRQLYPRLSFEAWRQSKKAQARKWTLAEIELAREIGKQFASAIQQYRLYQQVQSFNTNLEKQVQQRTQQLQQATEQQQAVFGVITKIRESLEANTIFQTTTKEACQLLQAERVSVYRFNSEWGGEFVGDFEAINPNWSNTTKLGLNFAWNDTYLQDTQGGRYRYNETFAVDDIYQMGFDQCHLQNLEHYQIRAFILAPIFVGEKLWGLLAAYQHTRPRHWHAYEINFLSQIAVQLGVALQQAELLAQTRQQALDLQQAAEQQRILFEVVAKMRESLDLDNIFAASVREVRCSLNAERVGIFRFAVNSNFNDGEFVSEDVLPDFPSALGAKVHDYCFGEQYAIHYAQGRLQAVADIYNAGLQECHIQVLAQFQIRANLVVPLAKGDQLWGLLCIHQCSQPRQWQPSEIQFITQVAAQLSVAIEQADLLTQTRLQAEQLAQALHDLQQMQTQLIQSEKMSSLGQLVAGVAHEINYQIIMDKHGGVFKCDSRLGFGTEFWIEIPMRQQEYKGD
jgi:GAF domain-containing protein